MTKIDKQKTKLTNHLMNVKQLAKFLGVSVNTIYSWVHQKRIPYIKVGRLVRFDSQDLDNWFAKNKVGVSEYWLNKRC